MFNRICPLLLALTLSLFNYRECHVEAFSMNPLRTATRNDLFSTRFVSMKNDDGDSLSRRKNRRSSRKDKIISKRGNKETSQQTDDEQPIKAEITSNMKVEVEKVKNLKDEDGSSSLEDLFGLGDDQLRELNEQILPLPREDLVTGKEVVTKDKDKVFKLPDLAEFMTETGGEQRKDRRNVQEDGKSRGEVEEGTRVDRKNQEEYLRVLQLNPFADADESMFLDEYDIIPAIFGSGKLLGIPVSFLQNGHGLLLVISSLAGFVYFPGNPLTELPPELRNFIKEGLAIVYIINTVLAVLAFNEARSKNLPGLFWGIKTFILGGIAFFEIKKASDPENVPYNGVKPEDRKAKRK